MKLRVINAGQLLDRMGNKPFPKGIIRKISVKKLLKLWEKQMEKQKSHKICLDLSAISQKKPPKIPKVPGFCTLTTKNTHREFVVTPEQFRIAKDTQWFEDRGNILYCLVGTRFETYVGMEIGGGRGPFDFREKETEETIEENHDA